MTSYSILDDEEKRIHEEVYASIEDIMGCTSLDTPEHRGRIMKKGLSKKRRTRGKMKAADFYSLSSGYAKSYLQLNDKLDKSDLLGTHMLITEQAFKLAGTQADEEKKKFVIDSSTGPDKHLKTIAIFMEGHFYGDIGDGKTGNFLQRVFEKRFLKFIDRLNDIDETAITNSGKYFKKYGGKPKRLESFAWALHYLQDLTAPHHAGNYAIFFSNFTDGFDTHFPFEKKARQMINANPSSFNKKAEALLKQLEPQFDPNDKKGFENFCGIVHGMSLKNIDGRIRGGDEAKWAEVINDALPLAIAATAAVLKKVAI